MDHASIAALLGAVLGLGAPELTGSVVANGGTARAVGAGHELAGTIGEAVAGRSARADLVLDGGFWRPALAPGGATIFTDGFED